jgi:protein-disulfide isomerase
MTQSNRERLRQAQVAAAKQKRMNRIIGVGAAVLALILIGVFVGVLFQNQGKASTASTVAPPNATSDGKAIVVNPGKAKAGAPVVELFFDYQCPVCKQFETAYGSAFASLAESGEIELRYRTMIFLDRNLNNDASLRAGVAATCADVAGKYSAFHEEVYTNQPETEGAGYTDALLRDTIPATVGISGDALTSFQACYDKQSTKAFVTNSDEVGTQDLQAVNKRVATPTVHVNGKDLPLSDIAGVEPSAAALGTLITSRA